MSQSLARASAAERRRRRMLATLAGAVSLTAVAVALPASAEVFNRLAVFPVVTNLPADKEPATETSAEIVAASEDGMTLVYSDSPLGAIGFVDITDPAAPKAAGAMMIEGEPTSVAVAGGKVLVGVNTSESFTAPSGALAVVDLATRTVEATCDLGGQPDSLAVSPDGGMVAIAIENERDEDLNDGEIPQLPAGALVIFSLANGVADCASRKVVDVTGLAEVAPTDPEPEFVDINAAGEIVLSLQENNHIVVVNGATGEVVSHFSAGAVDLRNVDVEEELALTFDAELAGVRREPDSVKWLDDTRFVAANEGDYEGGSRGFTIFSKTGDVLFDSGSDLDHLAAIHGHYPERRSGNKGSEPEGLEVATFGGQTYIFVLLERASMVAVYRDTGGAPEFVQMLPSGVGPEGAVAIPSRGLLATANEVDLGADGAARSHVSLFGLQDAAPVYPHLISSMDANGRPVGWGALSGLAADPATPGVLYAVNDSFFGLQPTIFTIDATATPARITATTRVTRGGFPAQKLDLEGIAADGSGGFWLASEGRTDRLIPHALYRVDAKGAIKTEVAFPAELAAAETRFGAEGVAIVGDLLWVAMQREWGDDPKGQVKLLAYDVKAKAWAGAVRYPLDAVDTGWIGLSEITAHGDYVYIVERDNQIGQAAKIKKLYRVAISALTPAALGGELPVVEKELVRDFLPDLAATGGYVVDKIEGFAVDAAGTGFAVTDNDGVDDSSGETLFFSIGKL